jgi:predicted MFS family arabinose efflux permease
MTSPQVAQQRGARSVGGLLGGRFDAFGERNFRIYFLGRMSSTVGDMVVPVALAFALLDLTGSAKDLGIVMACRSAPLIVFLLPGGVWADRFSRRRIMIATDTACLVAQGVTALLLVVGRATVWELGALQVLYGTANALFRPAVSGIVPQVVSPGRRERANALLALMRSAALAVGPALAGVLVVAVGPAWTLFVDAGSFAASALLLSNVRLLHRPSEDEAEDEDEPAESFFAELGCGWREFWSRTWLWVQVGSAAVWQIAYLATFMVVGPVIAEHFLGGPGAWATILTAGGIGAIAGGFLALYYTPSRPLLVGTALGILTVPQLALLALHAPTVVIAAAAFVDGIQYTFFNALWNTVLQEQIPPRALSRVSSYDWLGSVAFLPIGYAVVGFAAVAIGPTTTIWIAAAILAASTATVLAVPSVRALGRSRHD